MGSKMGYLRAEMKELWTDGMIEVSMETMKGQIVRKKDFYMVPLMEFKMVRKMGF